MRSFDIYADSSSNLTEELIEKYGIKIISYTYSIDGKESECYVEGMPFKEIAKNFYDAMRSGKETRTTLINKEKFIKSVTPSLEAGKDVLITTISAQISGTYNQAKLAAEELEKLYPERKVRVCDCCNAGLAEGLLAVYAANLGDLGEGVESCSEWLENNKMCMNSLFTVGDLKYLKRGGRISSALAIAGTILNIKPILKASPEATITLSENVRGRKKSLLRIADLFAELVTSPETQTVAIAHADCEEDATALAEMLKERGAQDIVINYYDICSGAHVGPGAIALFFMGKERCKNPSAKQAAQRGRLAKAKADR